MGVKLRIIESSWSKAIKNLYEIDIVGKVFSGTPYCPSNFDTKGDYYKIEIEIGASSVKIGEQAVIYKEEIFSDKEYEELWI